MELILIVVTLTIICSIFYFILLKIDNRVEQNYMHHLFESSDNKNEFINECRYNQISERKIKKFLAYKNE